MHSSHIKEWIAKKDLVDKTIYEGTCRNATSATWHADLGKFVYMRRKFGSEFPESIYHPEDEGIWDVFYPIEERK
jgi:hypothetical protein